LNVIKQAYARSKKIPIDNLTFSTTIQNFDQIKEKLDFGANLTGLFLEGCRVNKETQFLQESFIKEIIFPIDNIQ
jgi:hypothetical protein